MNHHCPVIAPDTHSVIQLCCPGVLIPADGSNRMRDTAKLVTGAGERKVVCSLVPPANLRWRVWRVRTDLLTMPNGDVVVTAVRRDENLDPLAFTPQSFCPVPGFVQSIRTLAGSITNPGLRRFLADVFADFRVFEDFWSAHGGPDHHHWPGGLAVHASQVAQSVSDALALPASEGRPWSSEERDVAIVAALTHDMGECTDNGRPLGNPAEEQRRIMEFRHLELLHDAVSNLHNTHRPVARGLLALWYPRQRFHPPGFRVARMREILLSAHRASVACGASTPEQDMP